MRLPAQFANRPQQQCEEGSAVPLKCSDVIVACGSRLLSPQNSTSQGVHVRLAQQLLQHAATLLLTSRLRPQQRYIHALALVSSALICMLCH